ncbi:hypothetical protein P2318_30960 [Myxococcaceae bacterium GXIMD 01537]
MREFFGLAFTEYRWFKPVHYGRANLTERDFLLLDPARNTEWLHTGRISWDTSVVEAKKPSWRAAHLEQVATLMRLFGSPLAYAGVGEDNERKMHRYMPRADGFGRDWTFTVRDYSSGLAGLF